MAFDNEGAAWLQIEGPVTNPYFGASMLLCGEERQSYAGRGGPGPGSAPAGKTPERAPGKKPQEPEPTDPEGFSATLDPMWKSYLQAQDALASDALARAKSAFAGLSQTVDSIDDSVLREADRQQWSGTRADLAAAAERGAGASDIATARSAFRDASAAVLAIEKQFGHRGTSSYYEVFCPMAFGGEGGTWLQTTDEVRNPFYGASMLGCGSVKQQHKARQGR